MSADKARSNKNIRQVSNLPYGSDRHQVVPEPDSTEKTLKKDKSSPNADFNTAKDEKKNSSEGRNLKRNTSKQPGSNSNISSRPSTKRTSVELRVISQSDLPTLLNIKNLSKYENLIYKTKKRYMHMAVKDFRINDKCYFKMRQGDIVCSVHEESGWKLVYEEDKPKRFGFVPADYLQSIKY
jgi:hypothetical protein